MSESYVYAITDSINIKIGVARHPYKRLKELSTGNAAKLQLLGFFSGGFELERQLHHRFRKVRENGEWLYATQELIDYLNTMIVDKHIMLHEGTVKAYMKIAK